jgi:Ca-activated chloride channel family protein
MSKFEQFDVAYTVKSPKINNPFTALLHQMRKLPWSYATKMQRIIAIAVLLLSLSVFTSAQSGRRVAQTPKPTTPIATDDSDSDTPDYSDSIPVKTRLNPIRPTLRQAESAPAIQTATTNSSSADSENDVVKVETDLVTIPVSVFDRNGLYIPGLFAKDFKIFEDGKEQKIAYFGTSDKPFTVVLLIDTSPSTSYKIEEIRAAAKAFVDQLKPVDNVMVISFDQGVHVHGEMTNDRQAIYRAIDKANFGGGTSLYDAVDVALRKQLAKIDGRKAIVLFTDGVDTTSRKTYDFTLDEAEESESLIFPIYYNTFFDTQGGGTLGSINGGMIPSIHNNSGMRGSSSEDYALGRKYLEDLAAYTGGRVFRPESTPGGLTAAFEGIAEELRRQYNIGYIPQDEGKPGQRKQIKVRVNRPNLIVRNRDSYIVGTTTPSKPAAAQTQKTN